MAGSDGSNLRDKRERDALRELLAAATPGPWETRSDKWHAPRLLGYDKREAGSMPPYYATGPRVHSEAQAEHDMAAIAAAVNALPALLDLVDELEVELDCGTNVAEKMGAERDQARAEHDDLRRGFDDLHRTTWEQTTRIATLEAALRKYGQHEEKCWKERASMSKHMGIDWDDSECVCGLDAALGEKP